MTPCREPDPRRPAAPSVMVRLTPGGHYVTRDPGEMIATILGSCVAACIRDPQAGIGGMNHFMLPESRDGDWGFGPTDLRFGNFAMKRLIDDIIGGGGRRDRLEVKVFGGGNLIEARIGVGERNAAFVETYLREGGLAIAAQHLRGRRARRVEYSPLTGRVRLLEMARPASPRSGLRAGG